MKNAAVASPLDSICGACSDELAELSREKKVERFIEGPVDNIPVRSLFRYSGMIRQLIIAAKAGKNPRALELLEELWIKELLKALPPNITLIAPCPSSLWSRLRGNLDVAWSLAHRLSKAKGVALRTAPSPYRWTLLKQTRAPRERKTMVQLLVKPSPQNAKESAKADTPQGTIFLLVDDVVTTGTTLSRCAASLALPERASFYALTLAGAFSESRN